MPRDHGKEGGGGGGRAWRRGVAWCGMACGLHVLEREVGVGQVHQQIHNFLFMACTSPKSE